MPGNVRTILAGLAVLALCLLLAVLSWQLLLCSFLIAGLGWAVWTVRHTTGKKAEDQSDRRWRGNRERAGSKRRKALRKGNVYEFPVNALGREIT